MREWTWNYGMIVVIVAGIVGNAIAWAARSWWFAAPFLAAYIPYAVYDAYLAFRYPTFGCLRESNQPQRPGSSAP